MKGLGGLRSTIVNLTIRDLDELYACFMPVVINGGLFIESSQQHKLGDEVFVVLELLNEPDKFPLSGKVVWVSPPGVGSNRKSGFAIQLPEENRDLVGMIETHLSGRLNSDKPTQTF